MENIYTSGRDYIAEIIEIIRCGADGETVCTKLSDYHDSDIADAPLHYSYGDK